MRASRPRETIKTVTEQANTYDGNGEWSSQRPRQHCTDGSVDRGLFNASLARRSRSTALTGGRDEEQTGVSASIVTNPANGSLGTSSRAIRRP